MATRSAALLHIDETPDSAHAHLDPSAIVCCVIPAYKCRESLCRVVESVRPYVDHVVVVDDNCPHGSGDVVSERFEGDRTVHSLKLSKNSGVGAAVKAGIRKAARLGADVIIKIDGDGQMDPSFIPTMAEMLLNDPSVVLVKGNRFTNSRIFQRMPLIRLLGNSALALCIRCASGYWDLLDPVNGYLAFNAHLLDTVGWEKFSDRYFFESSVICASGLSRSKIAELPMPAIYGDEPSSLSVLKSAVEFPPKLLWHLLKRVVMQYFVYDINIASLYMLVGCILCVAGISFGAYEWAVTIASGIPRTTGTVMLAVLPMLMGFQLLLNAILYDVQTSVKVLRQPQGWGRATRKLYKPRAGRTPS